MPRLKNPQIAQFAKRWKLSANPDSIMGL
jgi:hypothetical protein